MAGTDRRPSPVLGGPAVILVDPHLAEKLGERNLFVGPPRAQATSNDFHWPELVAVTDLASAQRALDTLLEQGEGARGHWEAAHFGEFARILADYRQMLTANPAFDPVRPVLFARLPSRLATNTR